MFNNNISEENLSNISQIFNSLSHPVRIKIMELLYEKGEMNVTDIMNEIGVVQSATSHHLMLLHKVGILGKKRVGKNRNYFLNKENYKKIERSVIMWN